MGAPDKQQYFGISWRFFGLTPAITINSSNVNSPIILTLANNAYGQQFTPAETESYAKAGYEVELLRREVYQEIKNLINEPPPNILCDQQSTINILKPEIKNIANRYCTESRQIVQRHSLSVNRFNELKTYYDRQDTFYQQVQGVLLKLQH
ncbi:MAG: DUF4168 domain-containing protein [Hydrococcus sp. SU_1_0]|nr:DUF4168 domain-containing protein [Hydrococcus sp. SU_1_0]